MLFREVCPTAKRAVVRYIVYVKFILDIFLLPAFYREFMIVLAVVSAVATFASMRGWCGSARFRKNSVTVHALIATRFT